MSLFRTSSIGNLTRGGQTTIHFSRMIWQVIRSFGLLGIACFVVLTVAYTWHYTTEYDRYLVEKWTLTKFSPALIWDADTLVEFTKPSDAVINTKASKVLNNPYILETLDNTSHTAVRGMAFSLYVVCLLLLIAFIFVYRKGRAYGQEKFIRGSRLADVADLKNELIKQKIAGAIHIAGVPLINGAETQGILVAGATGTGKSVILRSLCKQIRARGERAIVYSTAGDFIRYFYREGKDTVFNPMDIRSPIWDIWGECRNASDYDSLANSLIPLPKTGDPFWIHGARSIFSAVAMRMKNEPNRSTKRLLRNLLTIRLSEAARLVEGTEAAAIIAEGAEKTALSVRATLAAYIRSLKFLKDGKAEFSIRKWIQKDMGDDWLFVSSRPDQKASLRPLITLWFDIISTSILSLPEDRNRRIWIIIDELPSLNEVPSLIDTLQEGRKFGACSVLGLQSYSQLQEIYGARNAETMAGQCRTWVVFRANEPTTAELMSAGFGKREFMEANEGISYGVSDMRDGVTLNANTVTKPLLLDADLIHLPDLTGYIRLGADVPAAKITVPHEVFPEVAPSFVEADMSVSSMDLSTPEDEVTPFMTPSRNSLYDEETSDVEDDVLEPNR